MESFSASPATPQSPESTAGNHHRSVSSQLSLVRATAAEGDTSVVEPSIFIGGIGDWAKCRLCAKVPKAPMAHCVDECLFCAPCLVKIVDAAGDTKTKCPAPDCSRGLRRSQVHVAIGVTKAIHSLPVNCINKDSLNGSIGCAWTGKLMELADHLTQCQGLLVTCPYAPNGCSWQGMLQLAESHVTICPQRVITCTNGRTADSPGCGQQMFISNSAFHLEHICQFISCPNRLHKIDGTTFACPVFGLRRMILQHLQLCKNLNAFAYENRRLTQVVIGLVAQRKALMQGQAELEGHGQGQGQVPPLVSKEVNGGFSIEPTLNLLRKEGEGAGAGLAMGLGGAVANSMNGARVMSGVGGLMASAEVAGKGVEAEKVQEEKDDKVVERPMKRTRSGSKRD